MAISNESMIFILTSPSHSLYLYSSTKQHCNDVKVTFTHFYCSQRREIFCGHVFGIEFQVAMCWWWCDELKALVGMSDASNIKVKGFCVQWSWIKLRVSLTWRIIVVKSKSSDVASMENNFQLLKDYFLKCLPRNMKFFFSYFFNVSFHPPRSDNFVKVIGCNLLLLQLRFISISFALHFRLSLLIITLTIIIFSSFYACLM